MPTGTTKKELRARIRSSRTALVGTPTRAQRDGAQCSLLLNELDRRDPRQEHAVAAYSPLPGEPGGADLPEQIARTGRPVWLPVVSAPGVPLTWVRWRGDHRSRTGAFGIREPVSDKADVAYDTGALLSRVQTLIVPALAVGPDGVRLGQGGGFYDRTLADLMSDPADHGRLLAVVDHAEFGIPVPGTQLDITVPLVVTEIGVFPTGALHYHHPH